jgi:hypothetical protein
MESGELLTRWSVRIALALYVVTLVLRLSDKTRYPQINWARLAWTASFAAFLIHLICAFHFVHHWSHAAAYVDTARQTAEVVGFDWGGGLYANYAFAALWLADVFWWWTDPSSHSARSRRIEWTVQGFMAFIMFNATVVFGHGAIRWAGLAATAILAALLVRRH